MQSFFAIGNLTEDPDLSRTMSGASVCRFSIAVNRSYTNGDGEREADFFNCIAWRGLAENIAKYCKKGNKVAVSGIIQIRNYEDNKGNRQTAADVIVRDCEFLTPPKKENSDDARESTPQRQSPVRAGQASFFDDDYLL